MCTFEAFKPTSVLKCTAQVIWEKYHFLQYGWIFRELHWWKVVLLETSISKTATASDLGDWTFSSALNIESHEFLRVPSQTLSYPTRICHLRFPYIAHIVLLWIPFARMITVDFVGHNSKSISSHGLAVAFTRCIAAHPHLLMNILKAAKVPKSLVSRQ